MLINRDAGSYFFLGELYTDLPLPLDAPETEHCGTCTRCITACPTGAIVGPYQLNAKRCISYLTIELKGSIPEDLRAPMGNRIFGCDDCQLVCPWNKFAQVATEADFAPRHSLARHKQRLGKGAAHHFHIMQHCYDSSSFTIPGLQECQQRLGGWPVHRRERFIQQ